MISDEVGVITILGLSIGSSDVEDNLLSHCKVNGTSDESSAPVGGMNVGPKNFCMLAKPLGDDRDQAGEGRGEDGDGKGKVGDSRFMTGL